MKHDLILILTWLSIASCTTGGQFNRAVDDASVAAPKDVYDNLIPVRPGILAAVSWRPLPGPTDPPWT